VTRRSDTQGFGGIRIIILKQRQGYRAFKKKSVIRIDSNTKLGAYIVLMYRECFLLTRENFYLHLKTKAPSSHRTKL
jgi:hypothetical protein